ncbi:MAG: hypothetical protein U5Q03_17450 [Bacteroidota bacterium]|nr:hypothetical protein [Bacteroidota bacterium]
MLIYLRNSRHISELQSKVELEQMQYKHILDLKARGTSSNKQSALWDSINKLIDKEPIENKQWDDIINLLKDIKNQNHE